MLQNKSSIGLKTAHKTTFCMAIETSFKKCLAVHDSDVLQSVDLVVLTFCQFDVSYGQHRLTIAVNALFVLDM